MLCVCLRKTFLFVVVVGAAAVAAKHEYSRGYKKFISMISKLMYPKNTRCDGRKHHLVLFVIDVVSLKHL
jgi:hypothetical protein